MVGQANMHIHTCYNIFIAFIGDPEERTDARRSADSCNGSTQLKHSNSCSLQLYYTITSSLQPQRMCV